MGWPDYLKFFLALIFVLSMMGGLALLLKKLGFDRSGTFAGGKKRLKVIEMLPIGAKHKSVLIQQDDKQHLLLLGPSGDVVIKTDIDAPLDDENHNDKKS